MLKTEVFVWLTANWFKVGWKEKNGDTICYMLTSLISLLQEKARKLEKLRCW